MAGPSVDFTEDGRRKLAKVLGFAHWICIVPSFICLFIALYIQLSIEDKINFIENYNGALLPGFLVATGFFGLFIHVLSGKAIYSNRRTDKREKWAALLFPVVILTLTIFIFEFISGIMCFAHIYDLEDSFDDGIRVAMAAYQSNEKTKEEVDILQMNFECCGSRSYKDWFFLPWIPPEFQKTRIERLDPSLINDDVPFSCCNYSVLRPCIHRQIQDNGMHFNYDHRTQLTVYKSGCTDILVTFYRDTVLNVAGSLVLGLSFIQLIIAIFVRILQTAIKNSMNSDDEEGPSIGYIFTGPPVKVQDLNDTVNTETSEGEPLLDSTYDTILDDSQIENANETDNPVYENLPAPFHGDEEDIYNEEEYLVPTNEENQNNAAPHMMRVKSNHGSYMTMNASKQPNMTSVKKSNHGSYMAMNASKQPNMTSVKKSNHGSYMTMNASKQPNMTSVKKSNHDSYMAMDMSNSSRWIRNSERTTLIRHSSPIYRHSFPSPLSSTTTGKYPYVIDMSRSSISHKRTPMSTMPNDLSSTRCSHAEKAARPKHISPFKWSSPSIPPRHSSPLRTTLHSIIKPQRYLSPVKTSESQSCRRRSPSKKRMPVSPGMFRYGTSSTRHRSPQRSISPVRRTFKAGVSSGCNHALLD